MCIIAQFVQVAVKRPVAGNNMHKYHVKSYFILAILHMLCYNK